MSEPKKKPVDQATFYKVDTNGKNGAEILKVMFNPASLTYTVSTQWPEQGQNKQHVSSTAKLSMDLIFDTTDTGKDVREKTVLLANTMAPPTVKSKAPFQPQVIALDWGSFRFKGVLESYKETIDFFAPEGVPLRATVNISMKNQEKVFDVDKEKAEAEHLTKEQPLIAVGEGQDINDIANLLEDDPRAVGAGNGIENLRRPDVAVLALGASVQLSPPLAFASGGLSLDASGGGGLGASLGASFGASAGGSFGLSASAGFSASAGASFGASASVGIVAGVASRGIGAIGGSSSAGVSAIGGAFAGLQSAALALPRVSVDIERVQQSSGSAALSASATADFSVGGRASADGSSGLSADVGATATLRAGGGISFDE
jgi:contractile injection system tube protein